MIKFSECTISKAIEHGTNLSCIKGRIIVCKVIKDFVVDHDNNIVKFEEGDIIVCSFDMDLNGCKCLLLSEESYIKSLSSISFIKRDEDDFWQYKADYSLEQFKETFEVLDEETAALESCIEKSKDCYNFLRDKKTNVYHAQREYQSKANLRQGALGVTLMIVGVATFIAALTAGTSGAFSRYMEKAPFWVAALIALFIFGSLAVGAALCLFVSEGEDTFECFECKKTPLLDKAEEEYEEYRSNTINELDTFRQKIGWLTS